MQHILYLTCVEQENETLSLSKRFYNLVGFTDQLAASLASVSTAFQKSWWKLCGSHTLELQTKLTLWFINGGLPAANSRSHIPSRWAEDS